MVNKFVPDKKLSLLSINNLTVKRTKHGKTR